MRAVIYDHKREMVSLLCGMGLKCPVHVLNPFDGRSIGWDMAKDIDSPGSAFEIARTFIPEEVGSPNRFFSDAAHVILASVFTAFILRFPGKWTLRDVLCVLDQEQWLRELFLSCPQTRGVVTNFFGRESTYADIKATIASKTSVYGPIAALWHRSPQLSLREWLKGDSILVIGSQEEHRAPLDAVNRLLVQRLSQLVVDRHQGNEQGDETWWFIDEAKEAGKLSGLSSLLTRGRTAGARVVLGFQDIEGLWDVYGQSAANEIVGMAANKAFLRVNSHATAQWAAHCIGEAEIRRFSTSMTRGDNNDSWSIAEHIEQRMALLPSQILELEVARRGRFGGYFIAPEVGAYGAVVPFKKWLRDTGGDPGFIPRPVEHQHLAPWGPADFERLGWRPEGTEVLPTHPAAPPVPPSPLRLIPEEVPVTEEPNADHEAESPLDQIRRRPPEERSRRETA